MSNSIKNFFDNDLMPIAAKNKSKGITYIECHFEPKKETYFQTPINHGKGYFAFLSNETEEALTREFQELWHSKNEPELVHLAAGIAGIASERKLEPEQVAEVSDFVYVMH